MMTKNMRNPRRQWTCLIGGAVLTLSLGSGLALADDDDERDSSSSSSATLTINSAEWDSGDDRLRVRGDKSRRATVTVVNAFDPSQVIGRDRDDDDDSWRVRREDPEPVPCRVRAISSDGQSSERDVRDAPANCAPKDDGEVTPPPANQPPTANANGPYSGITNQALSFSSSGSGDPDGSIVAWNWDFGDNSQNATTANPSHTYTAAGTYTVTLTVTDDGGATDSNSTTATITDPDQPPANVPPTAVDDAYSTPQDTPLSVAAPGVLGNDSDGDGDPLSAELRSNPAFGAVNLNADGSFTYTPDTGFTGSDSFTYRANDGQDVSSDAP